MEKKKKKLRHRLSYEKRRNNIDYKLTQLECWEEASGAWNWIRIK
jgi:hypothetical protein